MKNENENEKMLSDSIKSKLFDMIFDHMVAKKKNLVTKDASNPKHVEKKQSFFKNLNSFSISDIFIC
jgi:hypothetical protein